MISTYASNSCLTVGRLFLEEKDPYLNEFAKDKERIINSKAFRRLQYKTQVFINHEGDHFRNRLTHSLEVACVARIIAQALSLSVDLTETVSLAHDLGHPPFGHAGEDALNKIMSQYLGFAHNSHTIKIVTQLENSYANFRGLNLTWESLEGIVKHNGPVTHADHYIDSYNAIWSLDLKNFSSLEAQVSALADDIAYLSHDIEDSLNAKIIKLDDLEEIDFLHENIRSLKIRYSSSLKNNKDILGYELSRSIRQYLIHDVIIQTKMNLLKHNIEDPMQVRISNIPLVSFSEIGTNIVSAIRQFLFSYVYKHRKLAIIANKCDKLISSLFNAYMDNINLLPLDWRPDNNSSNFDKATLISDYIACMTDRFAIQEYSNLFSVQNINNF